MSTSQMSLVGVKVGRGIANLVYILVKDEHFVLK